MYYLIPYMVKKESRTPPIRAIFEKNENGFPTENALLYQGILNYPFKTGNKRFKIRPLGIWLTRNHRDWKEYYDDPASTSKNTPYKARYENRKDRILAKVQHLLQMGLLSSDTTKAEKIDTEIPLLELTGEGLFISKMLARQDPGKKAG